MKHTLLLIALIPLIGLSQDTCNCKCWVYVPKNKNRGNSELFDSSQVQTRMNLMFMDQKTYFYSFIKYDSVDHFIFQISQSPKFREHSQIRPGQRMSFKFTDSTEYVFYVPSIIAHNSFSRWTIDEFELPLTDSFKYLLSHKTIKSILINNQGSTTRIRDREYKCGVKTDIVFSRIFCCFQALKVKRGIKL